MISAAIVRELRNEVDALLNRQRLVEAHGSTGKRNRFASDAVRQRNDKLATVQRLAAALGTPPAPEDDVYDPIRGLGDD